MVAISLDAPGNRLAPHAMLARRLADPPVAVDLAELASQWRTTSLRVVCEPPGPLEPGFWLPHAVRGAWGHALMRRHVPAVPDPFNRPSAFEAFFGSHARITAEREVPKPYVIATEMTGKTVAITLTLFGFADYWRPQAGDALIEAIEQGMSVVEGHRLRRGWRVLDAEWWQREGLDVPTSAPLVVVVLETPWRSGSRGALGTRLDDFAMSLLERASGLARWHGCRLDIDWRAWRSLALGLRFSNVDLHGAAWTRRSGRQGGRAIPEKGLIGRFVVDRPPAEILPAIAIGETCHAGAEASLGLGRFTVGGLQL